MLQHMAFQKDNMLKETTNALLAAVRLCVHHKETLMYMLQTSTQHLGLIAGTACMTTKHTMPGLSMSKAMKPSHTYVEYVRKFLCIKISLINMNVCTQGKICFPVHLKVVNVNILQRGH